MNQKGELSISGKTLGIIIAIIIIFVVFNWSAGLNLSEKLDLLLPEYMREPTENATDYGFDCPVHVAKVIDNYIHFCVDENCEQLKKENIYIEENKIYSDNPYLDDEIGNIQVETFISIKSYILEGAGDERESDVYFKIKDYLPPQEMLIQLQDSYFLTSAQKEICRREPVTLAEERDRLLNTVRAINVKGKTFFFDMDEFIKNKDRDYTPLYLDAELTKKSQSAIQLSSGADNRGEINLAPEPGEEFPAETVNFDLFNRNDIFVITSYVFYEGENSFSVKRYVTDRLNVNEETEWLPLSKQISNENNKLGFNTDGNPINQVKYGKFSDNGIIRVYIRLRTTVGFDDETEVWIMKDYWDAYQSLARVPDWAIRK